MGRRKLDPYRMMACKDCRVLLPKPMLSRAGLCEDCGVKRVVRANKAMRGVAKLIKIGG